MTRMLAISGLLIVAILAVIGAGVLVARRRPAAPGIATPTEKIARQASLYCEFYDFMHASVVTSFDFGLRKENGAIRYVERAEVDADKTETTFDEAARPVWTQADDDGTRGIASPDGATRIVLYGLRPHAPGVFWTEAGVRSNLYRNLEGKCRQAHLDALDP